MVVRLLALGFSGVEDLEDARNVFGISADHVTLRHRPHVEQFTVEGVWRRRGMVMRRMGRRRRKITRKR